MERDSENIEEREVGARKLIFFKANYANYVQYLSVKAELIPCTPSAFPDSRSWADKPSELRCAAGNL
jgi:hypothetical protein